MDKPINRKKTVTTTRQQFQIYLNELENNKCFRENKCSFDNDSLLKEIWKKLTKKLNSVEGPNKNTTAWKKVFTEWKGDVENRARLISLSKQGTHNDKLLDKPLTDLEIKLMTFSSKIVIDGMPVLEFGINTVKEMPILNPKSLKKQSEEVPVSSTKENITPRHKRKRASLMSSLVEATKERNEEILNRINNNIQKLIKIEQKSYQLSAVEFQLNNNNLSPSFFNTDSDE